MPAHSPTSSPVSSAWGWIPPLYFLQAIPNALAVSVFPIALKSLGLSNLAITAWLPLVTLPWTLKLLWAPFVDLTLTKRRWILLSQAAIALLTLLAAFALLPSNPLPTTLLVLTLLAFASATHDIAADGLYLLTLPKQSQAAFAGVITMSFRLGLLFCTGALVYAAGHLINREHFSRPTAWFTITAATAALYAAGLVYNYFNLPNTPAIGPSAKLPTEPYTSAHTGALSTPQSDPTAPEQARAVAPASLTADTSPQAPPVSADLLRTASIFLTGLAAYVFLAALTRLAGHHLANHFDVPAWSQSPSAYHGWAVTAKLSPALLVPLYFLSRRLLRNTEMAHALISYTQQPRFPAILFFILTYRLGEAMIGTMAPLFLLDPTSKGGAAQSEQALGSINGLFGTTGIILGGLLGGLIIARLGLKKSFWPLALAMHLPNLLYVLAAFNIPTTAAATTLPTFLITTTTTSTPNSTLTAGAIALSGNLGTNHYFLCLITFIDKLGYGIGFASYAVYLMYTAQRAAGGKYRTTHYAIATGLGSLTVTILATTFSGILQSALGYKGFFIAASVLTLPGLLSLLLIPIEEKGRGISDTGE